MAITGGEIKKKSYNEKITKSINTIQEYI